MKFFVGLLRGQNLLLPKFPPCGANQEISEADLVEIAENACDDKISKALLTQGFDVATATMDQLVVAVEKIEQARSIGQTHDNDIDNDVREDQKPCQNERTTFRSREKKQPCDHRCDQPEDRLPRKKARFQQEGADQKPCPIAGHYHPMVECEHPL